MTPIFKTVKRTWRERLTSLTPWKATRETRDYTAEMDAAWLEHRKTAEARARQASRKPAQVHHSNRPASASQQRSYSVYDSVSEPTYPASMYGLMGGSNTRAHDIPAPSSFSSGGGGDYGGGGASGSWDSGCSSSSSDSSSSSSSSDSGSCSSSD